MSADNWSYGENERAAAKQRQAAPPEKRADQGPSNAAGMLMHLQRTAGNQATSQLLQRWAAAAEAETEDNIGERIRSKSGGGSGLDAGVQRRLEGGLGADMSGVRVHTDGEADHLARSVSSVAFTTGNDIFFKSGAYNPGSDDGMRLLAHEAAHTVQQSAGPVSGTPSAGGVSISDPSDSFEQAAESAASKVVSGESAHGSVMPGGGAASSVQRAAEDEDIQQMRDPAAVQRAAEDEDIQQMRDPSVQRAAEDEDIQQMRDPSVQRAEELEDESEGS